VSDNNVGCGWVVGAGVAVLLLIAVLVVAGPGTVSVDNGHVGVTSLFGEVDDRTLPPGLHFVHPFKHVRRMNVQTQKDEEPATVPTKSGLPVQMKATLLWHLDPVNAVKMVKEVGDKDYAERVVSPYFRNAVRDVTAEYPPEAFYTADRVAVEAKVTDRVRKELEPRGVVVESVMLLDPVLPAVVNDRIQAKVGAEQDAQRMEYVLRQKKLEADAKVVEAKGIADAQMIIKKDLDHNYLVYLWIEALKESAKHNNAVIYIPTGGDGMPLFKGVADKVPLTGARP
jgi:regulator of protease activity HflC (stomatin/prohibitin superfamily)